MSLVDSEIKRYRKILPQYRESLDLLQKITAFQSSLADEILACPDAATFKNQDDSMEALDKLQSGQPLFGDGFVPVQAHLFLKGLDMLHTLLPEGSSRAALDRLLTSKSMTSDNIEGLLNELKNDFDSCIRRLAKVLSTNTETLHFLLQTVLSPFFVVQAGFCRDLVASSSWRQGKCPVCGSDPAIARLVADNGRRFLACFLCHSEWAFDRLRCPFCEHGGPSQTRHFTVGNDEAHRVECCDVCRRYLKVVDERAVGQSTSPFVEDIVTVHLDLLAREHKYGCP